MSPPHGMSVGVMIKKKHKGLKWRRLLDQPHLKPLPNSNSDNNNINKSIWKWLWDWFWYFAKYVNIGPIPY